MAIFHDTIEQGTPEWFQARLGIPTASEFSRIITAAKGDLSKSAGKYAAALVAETLLGRPLEKAGGTFAMNRGTLLEPFAREQYAADTGVEVREVGFVTTDDGRVGASPDGLIVGQRGGLEIKCTMDETHMGILFDGPGDDYRQQVQASLAICELEYWDLYCWHPNLPPLATRFTRDEPYIAKMRTALVAFLDMRDEMLARAHAAGWHARTSAPLPATFGALRAA